MGATNFFAIAKGKTAREAFDTAHDEAQWEHGHGGYTGTIAEKGDFVMARSKRPDEDVEAFDDRIRDAGWVEVPGSPYAFEYKPETIDPAVRHDAEVYNDKWGPCLCVKIDDNTWAFMGIASE